MWPIYRTLSRGMCACGIGVLVQACQPGSDQVTKKALEDLQQDVRALEAQVARHEESLDDYGDRLIHLEVEADNSAQVSATEGTFAIAKTEFGPISVSIKEAVPYVDGYRLRVQLGNLTSAELQRVSLKVAWGPPRSSKQFKGDAAGWRKAQHTKEFALTKPLQPGAFNSAEVVLSPAASEDLGQLTVTVSASGVALRRN